jgi:phosphoglycolate phosphatase
MNDRVIIFDFDGTIADSRMALVKIANRLAPEFGYSPVREEDLVKYSNMSSREVIENSLIPAYKIPFFLRRVKKELNKQIAILKPFNGIKKILIKLKNQGYSLGIITSNVQENVVNFLKNNDLDSYFDFIYSGTSLFGKNKIINQVIKQNKLAPEKTVYVGDETRDIEAAKKSQIKIVAVTWGFNSADVLAEYQPDFLIDIPEQLTEILADLVTN